MVQRTPMEAARLLEELEMPPALRRRNEEYVNAVLAEFRNFGNQAKASLDDSAKKMQESATSLLRECVAEKDAFLSWVDLEEPTAKERRQRRDSLLRKEKQAERLIETLQKTNEEAAAIAEDPIGYATKVRQKFPALGLPDFDF